MRHDGRGNDQLRPVKIVRGFTETAAGSVLWTQGKTVVLCTASISADTPPWFTDERAGGWATCDYVMLPASTPQRKPWPKTGHTDARGTEIQRIIWRSLRAVLDLSRIGPHTIALDCQVLQADGGTRTASICGAYVALVDAIAKLPRQMPPPKFPPKPRPDGTIAPRFDPKYYDPTTALMEPIAAVSVGAIDGELRLDLDYQDDSRAEVDLNVAMTASEKFAEVQGSAENGGGFDRAQLNAMLDLAVAGCKRLMQLQREALTQ